MSTTTPAAPEPFVDRHPVQKLLNDMSDRAFWRAVHEQGLPYYKLNDRRLVFRISEIEQWLANRRVA